MKDIILTVKVDGEPDRRILIRENSGGGMEIVDEGRPLSEADRSMWVDFGSSRVAGVVLTVENAP